MSALLTSVLSETDKVVRYIAECGRLSISVLPPHVNDSKNEFEPLLDGHVVLMPKGGEE